MYAKINYSPYYYLNSRHLNLLDFGLELGGKTQEEKLFKIGQNQNRLLNFVELTFNYARWIFPRYSCDYSNHIYNQHQLFTILALKTYLKTTYREIIEILDVSDKITNYLKLNKLPHYTTIQKFFVRMSDTKIKDLNKLILLMHPINCELAAIDGTGRTSDYADHYYAKIRGKCRKNYIKNHITINVDTRMILNYAANRGSKIQYTIRNCINKTIKNLQTTLHTSRPSIRYRTNKKMHKRRSRSIRPDILKNTSKNRTLQTKQCNNLLARCICTKNECRKCNLCNKKKIQRRKL